MSSKFGFSSTAEGVAEACAPQIKGKVILTTGVSPGGIGAAFVEAVAQQSPSLLILAGRDASKCKGTADSIAKLPNAPSTRILELDLSDQAQIRKAAEEVLGYEEPLDVIVNNAGVMGTPYSTTKDSLEMQFGANHIGHFLLTNLLMPKLLAAKDGARVVSVSSDGYRLGPVRFDDYSFDNGKTYDRWLGYGQSKTANNLFALALSKRFDSRKLTATSLHPGVIYTNLMRFMSEDVFQDLRKMDRAEGNKAYWGGFEHLTKTASQGAATHVYCAFHPDVSKASGRYFQDSAVVPQEEMWCWGRDELDAEKLWKLSERLVGQEFTSV